MNMDVELWCMINACIRVITLSRDQWDHMINLAGGEA